MAQRIITAFFLIAGLLFIVLGLPAIVFEVTCIAIALIATWEWTRVANLSARQVVISYVSTVGFLLLAHTALFDWMIIASVLLVGYALLQVTRYEKIKNYRTQTCLLSVIGPLLFTTATSSLPKLLNPDLPFSFVISEPQTMLLFYVIIIIGVADSGAYFVGRSFGVNKLASKVSPNKTVEGLLGGLVGVIIASLILSGTNIGFFFDGKIELIITSLLIALVSVAGDLFISTIKRQNNIKDASQLLPGHGGVLDRIDGWLLAVPVYYFFTLFLMG